MVRVQSIQSTQSAFAAVLEDGFVATSVFSRPEQVQALLLPSWLTAPWWVVRAYARVERAHARAGSRPGGSGSCPGGAGSHLT